eukprot:54910-Amphidinium_carterae.1
MDQRNKRPPLATLTAVIPDPMSLVVLHEGAEENEPEAYTNCSLRCGSPGMRTKRSQHPVTSVHIRTQR